MRKENKLMALEWRCPKHPTYRGLRRMKTDCVDCRELYERNEAVRIAHKEMKKAAKAVTVSG